MSVSSRLNRRRILVVTVSLAILAGVFAFPSFAKLSGSNFESSDGNLARSLASPSIDWCSLSQTQLDAIASPDTGKCPAANEAPSLARGIDLASGSQDNAFTNGTKQDDDPPSVGTGGIPPNKDDLVRFYIAHDSTATASYVYLGWERSPSNSASAHEGFEFNKKRCTHVAGVDGADCSTNHVTPKRSAGDLLVVYDFEGGSSAPTLSSRRWILSGACEVASDSAPCWGVADTLDANEADGLTNNAGSVIDPLQPGPPRTITTNGFGEAAINLTASGILPSTGPCVGFGSAYVVSRSSGNSAKSTMKDFIAPIPVEINNCQPAHIKVVKTASTGAQLTGVVFDLFEDNGATAGVLDINSVDPTDDDTLITTCTTAVDNNGTPNDATDDFVGCSFADQTGTGTINYIIHEHAAPANFSACSDDAFSITYSNVAQTHTFTCLNTAQPGTINIQKNDDAGNPLAGVRFDIYTDNGPNLGPPDGAANPNQDAYDDSEDSTTSAGHCVTAVDDVNTQVNEAGTCSITSVPLGKYWVVEDPTTVPDGHTGAADQYATIGAGTSLTLTFVNPRLHKVVVIVCHEGTDTLAASDVTDGTTSFTTLAAGATLPAGVSEADLCSLDGFEDLGHGTKDDISVDVGSDAHP